MNVFLIKHSIIQYLWGSIITDLSYQTNYWLSFPVSNSDVLLSLTIWQYWWWFWFTYFMCLYYFIFSRLIRHRLLKFSPRIVTSQKSHGKWGDFIVCLVPISWCTNILSNSNFILRMLEWQTESSLFTVRIRGRQWYWVYKIESKDLLNINGVRKNVGHNKWSSINLNSSKQQINLNLIQLKAHNKDYLISYKNALKSLINKNLNTSVNFSKIENANNAVSCKNIKNLNVFLAPNYVFSEIDQNVYFAPITKKTENIKNHMLITQNTRNLQKKNARLSLYSQTKPLNISLNKNKIISLNWNQSQNGFKDNISRDNMYFVIKQKRYAPSIQRVNALNLDVKKKELFLQNTTKLNLIDNYDSVNKWSAKRLKNKSSNIPLTYSKRLLRTKRTLVLPAGVNITLITNSFDVVHSWYIPGLGIKLDCIPGRSTHHTLFIDHAGFYYGQCAEICGRYHHHMPIRVCALPFEHFLIWWYHYGLPYFNSSISGRKQSVKNGLRQYTW